jgi:hypothetical protein
VKNGKRPNRSQMKLFIENGLNPKNWLIVKKQHDHMLIVHRETGRTKTIII